MPYRIQAEPRQVPDLRSTESGNHFILSSSQTGSFSKITSSSTPVTTNQTGSFSEPTPKNTSFEIRSSRTPVNAAAIGKIMVNVRNRSYTLKQVVKGTKGFSPKNEIGEGRFGKVYKCELPIGGPVVAVRRLSPHSHQLAQQIKREVYLNQLIEHDNIVQLFGDLCDRGLQLLVYEYMEHKSIAHALFDPNSEIQLNWARRYNICIEVAKGLEYLHNSSFKIVHQNITSGNILLDECMKPKISNFGLAKLFEEDYPYFRFSSSDGMYAAPEYSTRNVITDKADVYSFGVVLLENVSGKRNADYRSSQEAEFLLDTAFVLQSKDKLLDLVDGRLLLGDQTYYRNQAIKVLELAMMCLDSSPKLRPSMSQVVNLLEDRITIEQLSEQIKITSSRTTNQTGSFSEQNTSSYGFLCARFQMLFLAMVGKLSGQVFTARHDQAQYAIQFQSQFASFNTQLELMNAFLTGQESAKNKNEDVKTALKQIGDLIYDADDILTDCLLRDEYRQDQGWTKYFSRTELKFINETGNKLREINSKIDELNSILGTYLRPQQPSLQGGSTRQFWRFTFQDCDLSEIVGLETDVVKIKGWYFGTNEPLLKIGVVGMGGLGKTTVAHKLFHDRELIDYFDHMIWVSVSQEYSEESIMGGILEQVGAVHCSITDQGRMLRKIHQVLEKKSCLIVIDDVWEIDLDWWSKLCSALSNSAGKTSCAIITTRSENVAISMGVDTSRIHRPKILNGDDSWKLFCMCAFSGNKGRWPNEQFKTLGQKIAEKCHGLPLAIKTIGGFLAPKLYSFREWGKVQEDFHKLTTTGAIDWVAASLRLSYDALPPYLKHCLLCFAIFPQDMEVYAEQVVNWWLAEGLVDSIEKGYEHLHDLVSRCLIEAVQRRGYDGRVYTCKMHNLVRDLLINISEEENLCSFDSKGRQILTQDSRWLGFTRGMEIDARLINSSPKLRAFLVMPDTAIPFGDIMRWKLNSLRVLDFSKARLESKSISVEDLFTWICSLKLLACLNLSGLRSLKELPSSIQKLKNLQILILTDCINLTKISASVTFLKRLVVLGLGSCPRIDFLPKGLDQLLNLQELSGFRVVRQGNTNCSRFSELRNLSKLRVLRMSISSGSEITDEELDVLSNLKDLRLLSIDTENSEDKKIVEMLNQLSPPPSLQELYLRRYRHETLPQWVNPKNLSTLQYLCIEDADVSCIQTPHGTEEEKYPSWGLQGLCLKFLRHLVGDWKEFEQEMPLLQYVEVSHCLNLQNFPCSV